MIGTVIIQAVVGLLSGLAGMLIGARMSGRTGRRLDDLEANRITRIERDLDRLSTDGCRTGACVAQQLKSMNAQLGKIDGKLDRISETTSGQAKEIRANEKFIDNLDKSFQRHKETDHHG